MWDLPVLIDIKGLKGDVSKITQLQREIITVKQFVDWNQFVANKLWAWEQTNLAWAKNFTGDTLVVFYDKLVDDVEGTLRTILKFINFPIDEVRICF